MKNPPLRIGVDTRIFTSQKTGVSYYIDNLVENLLKIDKKNEYVLFGTDLEICAENSKQIVITGLKRKIYSFLWRNFNLPKIESIIGEVDILFCPNFTAVPAGSKKIVLTIPDLSFKKFPKFGVAKNINFLDKYVPKSIKKASQIVTISEAVKKEIVEYYNVPKGKIAVIPPAINQNVFKKSSQSKIMKVKEKYTIRENYFLFASTLEPRKNILNIIKAYISLPKDIKDKYDLVLAGGEGWNNEETLSAIKEAKKSGNKIIVTGYVMEADLPSLYSGASLFLFPSLYEGFGMPILEAMASGTPVITSNVSSMPEVAGGAALLVNPENAEEINSAITKIVKDNNLSQELIEKGFEQVKKFSWEESAKKLLKIFAKLGDKIRR